MDGCSEILHVDAANHNRQSLKNLIGIMYSKEDILFKALQVDPIRARDYCQTPYHLPGGRVNGHGCA